MALRTYGIKKKTDVKTKLKNEWKGEKLKQNKAKCSKQINSTASSLLFMLDFMK